MAFPHFILFGAAALCAMMCYTHYYIAKSSWKAWKHMYHAKRTGCQTGVASSTTGNVRLWLAWSAADWPEAPVLIGWNDGGSVPALRFMVGASEGNRTADFRAVMFREQAVVIAANSPQTWERFRASVHRGMELDGTG